MLAEADARQFLDNGELQLAQQQRKVVEIEAVDRWITGMISRAKSVLCAVPDELADRLAQESDPREYAESHAVIALAGRIAERRCQRGSAPGWIRSRTREERVAFHEAGDSVVGAVFGHVVAVTITPCDHLRFGGRCRILASADAAGYAAPRSARRRLRPAPGSPQPPASSSGWAPRRRLVSARKDFERYAAQGTASK